jgi:hypothetical protein
VYCEFTNRGVFLTKILGGDSYMLMKSRIG